MIFFVCVEIKYRKLVHLNFTIMHTILVLFLLGDDVISLKNMHSINLGMDNIFIYATKN